MDIEEFLENDKQEVMIGYKSYLDEIDDILDDFPETDHYIIADMFRNYTLGTLDKIAEETVGKERLYGVRNLLPNDIDSSNFRVVRGPDYLKEREKAISDIIIDQNMSDPSEPELVYILDDIDIALGFNQEKELFRYVHQTTGSFQSLNGNSILLAKEGYEGILRNLATVENDFS